MEQLAQSDILQYNQMQNIDQNHFFSSVHFQYLTVSVWWIKVVPFGKQVQKIFDGMGKIWLKSHCSTVVIQSVRVNVKTRCWMAKGNPAGLPGGLIPLQPVMEAYSKKISAVNTGQALMICFSFNTSGAQLLQWKHLFSTVSLAESSVCTTYATFVDCAVDL